MLMIWADSKSQKVIFFRCVFRGNIYHLVNTQKAIYIYMYITIFINILGCIYIFIIIIFIWLSMGSHWKLWIIVDCHWLLCLLTGRTVDNLQESLEPFQCIPSIPWWSNCLTITGWWFQPTPLKNDGVKVSWDDDIPKYSQ
jgi:hypothetical protein